MRVSAVGKSLHWVRRTPATIQTRRANGRTRFSARTDAASWQAEKVTRGRNSRNIVAGQSLRKIASFTILVCGDLIPIRAPSRRLPELPTD